jgi:hypothetical protein
MKPESYREESFELAGWPVHLVSYKLGETWICKIDNVSPGALVARAKGATQQDAEGECRAKAERRLAATRRVPAEA